MLDAPEFAQAMTRIARQAPAPPSGPPSGPPSRVARQAPAPPSGPPPPPARFVRQASDASDKATHVRQEAFYTSVTQFGRDKREVNVQEA